MAYIPYRTIILILIFMFSALCGTVYLNFAFPLINLLLLLIFAGGIGLFALIVKLLFNAQSERILCFTQFFVLIVLGSIVCQMLLTLGASLAKPLIDETLIRTDQWVGFDWIRYFQWLSHHPTLAKFLDLAYDFMLPEILLVLLLLSLHCHYTRAEQLVNAYLIALGITTIIATLWPAMAAYVHYNINPADYGLAPPAARIHEVEILALRNQELRHFPVIMKGIVTFPSFHAMTAMLLIWAAWPLRYYRIFSLVANGAMIVSVLVSGGHYLVDILACFIITPLSLYLAKRSF